MKFLGMGSLEILAILIIDLLVLGPERMVKSARRIGDSIRELKRAMWKAEKYFDEDNPLSSLETNIDAEKHSSDSSLINYNTLSINETPPDELHKTKSDPN